MQWGIIGTGNMGGMLTTSLLKSGAISANSLTIYNRSMKKAKTLEKEHKELTVAHSLNELQRNCDIIFICVKPHDYKEVLKEIGTSLTEQQCLVSITSPISVRELEGHLPCQVARIVPSITNRALSGVSLFTFGDRITEKNKQTLKKTFQTISDPVEIEEEYIRVASDIVSCGPAFISLLLKKWIIAANGVTNIPEEKATQLSESMMVGLGELLSQKVLTLDELMAKVNVKGGVTGEGLTALENNIGDLFYALFEATQNKHKEDKQSIEL